MFLTIAEEMGFFSIFINIEEKKGILVQEGQVSTRSSE